MSGVGTEWELTDNTERFKDRYHFSVHQPEELELTVSDTTKVSARGNGKLPYPWLEGLESNMSNNRFNKMSTMILLREVRPNVRHSGSQYQDIIGYCRGGLKLHSQASGER